jgi:hypothetical protein
LFTPVASEAKEEVRIMSDILMPFYTLMVKMREHPVLWSLAVMFLSTSLFIMASCDDPPNPPKFPGRW